MQYVGRQARLSRIGRKVKRRNGETELFISLWLLICEKCVALPTANARWWLTMTSMILMKCCVSRHLEGVSGKCSWRCSIRILKCAAFGFGTDEQIEKYVKKRSKKVRVQTERFWVRYRVSTHTFSYVRCIFYFSHINPVRNRSPLKKKSLQLFQYRKEKSETLT